MFGLNFRRDGGSANGTQHLNEAEKNHNRTYGITSVNPIKIPTGREVIISVPAVNADVTFGPYQNPGDYTQLHGEHTLHVQVYVLAVDPRNRRCPSCNALFFIRNGQIGYKTVTCPDCGLTVQGTPNYVR